ncbi:hypothetical protein [Hymenobacter sp.]|uniref:hypothetical protein n=1 Tax=Hymenobacter sp. TaxID=1898978 RepID=UPI00286C7120|nr:hypothetical protein [Hymenobacter sp.]
MKTIIRILALASFLALGDAAPVAAVGMPVVRQRAYDYTYQEGYSRGFRETQDNKCIDGNNFSANYLRYEQQAQINYDSSVGTPEEEYFRGYLDGMHEGYNQPAYCGPTGGGGPGGSNPPCSTCGPGPFIPE